MRFLAVLFAALSTAWGAPKTLDVHLIDVEGGKCLLVITPAGESLLMDAGWPASANREASTDRILQSLEAAGVKQLDYLLISHYDVDHIGDVPRLAARVPIRHLVDHGAYTGENAGTRERYGSYARLYETIPHIAVKAGDRLPLKGIDVQVITAAGEVIHKPVKGGGGVNPFCAANPRKPELLTDKEDNNSVGLLFTWGKFRMLDLADLEAYKNYELACPKNLIGTVDVYQANVHAQFKGMAPELIGAIHPRIAMVGNGARKGGDPPSWPVLRNTPGIEDIWQSHYAVNGGKDNNPPEDFIANLEPSTPSANDRAQILRLSALPDGSFTVTNGRNGFSKSYGVRK